MLSTLTLKKSLQALSQKRYKQIHGLCIEEIKRDVSNSLPYFLLGVIAFDHGNFVKAEELFDRAETLDANEPHYPAYLARLHSELRKPEAAEIAANRAATKSISEGYLADMLGVVYSRTGFHERAIVWFKNAVSLDNRQANFFYNLGASELFLGNFDQARLAFSKTISIDDKHYGALSSLVALDKQTEESNHLEKLTDLFDEMSKFEDAQHQLGHAIAKTLEDLGRHEDSLTWLHKAKILKRKKFAYNREKGAETFAAARQTIRAQSNRFNTQQTPIFVVGLPRTGTTLVERILSSHSEIHSAGELNFFADIVKSQTGTSSNLVLDAETFLAAQNIDLQTVGQKYMERISHRVGKHQYIVDKMPFNFFYAALISKAIPEAKIVALRRGAMDSCLSNYRQLLSVQESFYNYTYSLEDIAFFYRQFDGLMSHWSANLSAQNFMEIRYEEIVFDQEHQTRRLLEFCGLEFEEACLRFHENASPVSTASSVQVRQPLYSGSIGRWKKYGDRLDNLRHELGELAD